MEVAPVVCTTCGGPWYLKGFIGAANPVVGNIDNEIFDTGEFTIFHEDIKSAPLFGLGLGYDTGHYSASTSPANIAASRSSSRRIPMRAALASRAARTNTPPTSRAGWASPTCISISAPGTA
ncbi:MAG: hypothetical protein ACR2J1_09855 [Methyloceanibacter sp.]|uniref:hypothetical protein n=1 Tax=Methyloceanibacter sp. TaxID=1965321 RepID=UPI003D9BC00E